MPRADIICHHSIWILVLLFLVLESTGCGRSAENSSLTILDLGEVMSGPLMEGKFRVRNDSRSAFRITDLQKSCSCQSAQFDDDSSIEPGCFAEVTVGVPTKGHEGVINYNFVMCTTSEDERFRSVPLFLTAKVRSKIKCIPSELSFGVVAPGDKPVRTLTLTSLDVSPSAKFLGLNVKQATSQVRAIRRDSHDDRVVVDVLLEEQSPVGEINASIVLSLDDSDVPILEIPITGRVEGFIRPTPQTLIVDRLTQRKRQLRLTARDKIRFGIQGASSSAPIKVTDTDSSLDGVATCMVSVPEEISPGRHALTLETDHPKQKTVTLNIVVH